MATEVPADLLAAASAVAERAHAPFSHFHVGAAARCSDGVTRSAANVESASYVAGICAETALVGVLVADGLGVGDLTEVVVASPAGELLSPCGRCRQLLIEIGGPELLVNGQRMADLLPGAFTATDLA